VAKAFLAVLARLAMLVIKVGLKLFSDDVSWS